MTETLHDQVFLADLKVREDQKYRLEDKAGIEALAKTIDEAGILHNLVTDPEGFICSGTRRFGALKLLKWDQPIPRRIVSKEMADAILLAANSTTQAPDPMHDSAIVQGLADKGWTIREIADTIGWTPMKVALLRQLQNLSPKAKKALEDANHYMRKWPYEWIESFAQLSHESQDEALEQGHFQHVSGHEKPYFDRLISQFFHVLGKAPWDIEDATLVPEAGACNTCQKHSGSTPYLFEEVEEKDVRKFVCKDVTCWLKKSNACAALRIAKLREKNPEAAIVVDHGAKEVLPVLKDHPAFMDFQVTPCAKTEKGAVPALFFRGDGSMDQKYIRKPAETATPAKAPRAKAAKEEVSEADREKRRQERLEAQRRSWIINDVIEKLNKGSVPAPSYDVVIGLIAAYGVQEPLTGDGLPRHLHGNAKVRKELFASVKNEKKFVKDVWDRLRRDITQSITAISRGEMLDDEYEEAMWIVPILGMGTEREFRALAEAKIPTPKTLQPKPVKAGKPVKKKVVAKGPVKKTKRGGRAEDGFQPE